MKSTLLFASLFVFASLLFAQERTHTLSLGISTPGQQPIASSQAVFTPPLQFRYTLEGEKWGFRSQVSLQRQSAFYIPYIYCPCFWPEVQREAKLSVGLQRGWTLVNWKLYGFTDFGIVGGNVDLSMWYRGETRAARERYAGVFLRPGIGIQRSLTERLGLGLEGSYPLHQTYQGAAWDQLGTEERAGSQFYHSPELTILLSWRI